MKDITFTSPDGNRRAVIHWHDEIGIYGVYLTDSGVTMESIALDLTEAHVRAKDFVAGKASTASDCNQRAEGAIAACIAEALAHASK